MLINIYNPHKVSHGSVSSIESLASCLDLSPNELFDAKNLPADQRYNRHEVPKKNGTTRSVFSPHPLIRKVQRRLNRRIFSDPNTISWPNHIFGSIPNQDEHELLLTERDYINCAKQHCGAKSILTLDIRDFFDNIHQSHVEEIFSNFLKFEKTASELAADICCLNGHVVQGALTSSYIASLCLWDVEGHLVKKLGYKNLTYTRFIDDINISSKTSKYNFEYANRLVEKMLDEKGLPLNEEKTKTQYNSTKPSMVHGLRVNFKEPRLPSSEIRNIRAAVKNVENLSRETKYRASYAYRKDFNSCMGRVNKLQRVGHNQHEKLVTRLNRVIPLPSKRDLSRTTKVVERLEKDYLTLKETYWYRRRFYLAHERLNLLQRVYSSTAAQLRARLKEITPTYDYET